MPREARRDPLYLADIVEASRTVARWLDSRGALWHKDEILRNAVLRQLCIVGEASSSLSEEIRLQLPDIPWRQIRGFRNMAVHAYFSIDWEIVREVAVVNLPDMEIRIAALLRTAHPAVAARLDGAMEAPPD